MFIKQKKKTDCVAVYYPVCNIRNLLINTLVSSLSPSTLSSTDNLPPTHPLYVFHITNNTTLKKQNKKTLQMPYKLYQFDTMYVQ